MFLRNARMKAAIVSLLVSVVPVVSVATPVAAAPADGTACFESDNPQWAPMRAEADRLVVSGELDSAKAEAYKCDPRLIYQDFAKAVTDPAQAKVTVTQVFPTQTAMLAAAKKAKNKCVEGYFLTHELGTPTTIKAKQSINFCFNGSAVSDWSGVCEATITAWGKTTFWSFDGCPQNDWIPYTLNKKHNGGIHHKTRLNFINKTPWTYDVSTLLEQWGHYDGTVDQMVDGKLLHR